MVDLPYNHIPVDPYELGTPITAADLQEASRDEIIERYVALHGIIAATSYEASHDQLTGLPNRRWLEAKLANEVDRAPGQFSLLFLDLDGLKATNDTHGHQAGDELIQKSAHIFDGSLRSSLATDQQVSLQKDQRVNGQNARDASSRVAVRLAGDELVGFLSGVSSPDVLANIIARVQANLAKAGVEASIGGVVHVPGQTGAELISTADTMMYEQKQVRKAAQEARLPLRKRIAAKAGRLLTGYAKN